METDTLVSAALILEIEAAAQQEPSELVEDAVRQYLTERRLFRRGEVHQQIAQGLESLRRGNVLDGEMAMAELLGTLDAPDR